MSEASHRTFTKPTVSVSYFVPILFPGNDDNHCHHYPAFAIDLTNTSGKITAIPSLEFKKGMGCVCRGTP